MNRPIAFVASAVMLGAVLAACEGGEGGSGWCTDDALVAGTGATTKPQKPSSSRTSWKPKTSKPTTYRTTSKPHGSHGWHWDSDDCEWDDD